MPDNGIKFLARGGVKLDDAIEAAIEKRLREPWDRPTGGAVGRVRTTPARSSSTPPTWSPRSAAASAPRARRRSRSSSTAPTAPPPRSARWRCAEAGAEVIAICAEPDGLNINDGCGSTHLEVLAEGGPRARRRRRLRPRRRRRPLPGGRRAPARSSTATRSWPSWRWPCARPASCTHDTVVATVMSNLGFVQAMKAAGRRRTPDQGRGPLRPRGDEGLRLHPRWRAVRPRDHEPARHHRRRHPHRPARAGPDGRDRPLAGRARRRDDAAAAGAGQRARRRQGPRRRGLRARRGGRRGRGRARRQRPGAAAPLGHRAARAGDGRGGHRRPGPADRRPAGRRRPQRQLALRSSDTAWRIRSRQRRTRAAARAGWARHDQHTGQDRLHRPRHRDRWPPGPRRVRGRRPRPRAHRPQGDRRPRHRHQPRAAVRRRLRRLLPGRARPGRQEAGRRRLRLRRSTSRSASAPRATRSPSPPTSSPPSPASTTPPPRSWSRPPTRCAPTPRPPAATCP